MKKIIVLTLIASAVLTGCAPIAAFGVAGTAGVIAADRRSNAVLLEDQKLELEVDKVIKDLPFSSKNHINRVSYNGDVLLLGEVPTQEVGLTLENGVKQIAGVKKVYNELYIAPPSSYSSRAADSLLTTKVKSNIATLPAASDFYFGNVKVVTERGTVYLLGLLQPNEIQPVIDKARSVNGVNEVVPLFQNYVKGN